MPDLLIHPETSDSRQNGVVLDVSPQRAGWKLLGFSARRLKTGQVWSGETGGNEHCLVLQSGTCRISFNGGPEQQMGPRAGVFAGYPHAAYLPLDTRFRLLAVEDCEIAEGFCPARKSFPPRVIRPEDCGYEIRGGGNATRQIVDVMPPDFPADRLLVCEVYTPSGNWSSYPPHKHDQDRPPREVKLEEFYYYRFAQSEAYGFQRVYTGDGSMDETVRVTDQDLMLIPRGYHPFVTAYGYDAYYLNFLAGEHRSMSSSDDPQYAQLKAWPSPDPRLPVVEPPYVPGVVESQAAGAESQS
ncbi:MAG TPA: 5-deoxy-glucuronate isomerase [Acidobacteriota bacterium]|nr:5-deoxy-glucuronate isomerase [Acidobacteriota bacterium]